MPPASQARGAGLFHGHAHGEHAIDEEKDVPLDGRVGIGGFQAPGQADQYAAGEGTDLDGHPFHGGGADHGDDDADHERDLARLRLGRAGARGQRT
jgi:hypothetical protein